jgi:hypothetical protein
MQSSNVLRERVSLGPDAVLCAMSAAPWARMSSRDSQRRDHVHVANIVMATSVATEI